MILNNLQDSSRVETLHPLLKTLFDYVKSHDLAAVEAGRIELQGNDLFINVADAQLMTREEQKLEVHREYLDVHFPLSGKEIVGWRALSDIPVESEAPFDTEKDFALYPAPASTYVEVQPGEFLIVYPEDAHAPIIGEGTLRKLIAKVRIDAKK